MHEYHAYASLTLRIVDVILLLVIDYYCIFYVRSLILSMHIVHVYELFKIFESIFYTLLLSPSHTGNHAHTDIHDTHTHIFHKIVISKASTKWLKLNRNLKWAKDLFSSIFFPLTLLSFLKIIYRTFHSSTSLPQTHQRRRFNINHATIAMQSIDSNKHLLLRDRQMYVVPISLQ